MMQMQSDFGRRVVEQRAPDHLASPAAHVRGLAVQLCDQSDVKERVRTALMGRIDPAAAARMAREALKTEIATMVREIATEERAQLNLLEESLLADELTLSTSIYNDAVAADAAGLF